MSSTNPQFPAGFEREFAQARHSQSQFEIVRQYFAVDFATTDNDIRPGTLYYLRGKDHDHLIVIDDQRPASDTIHLKLALTGKPIKPLSKKDFLRLGDMQKLFVLAPLNGLVEDVEPDSFEVEQVESPIDDDDRIDDEKFLDMGAFNHLLDAAKRCGLVPDADVIAHVRDREFRKGDYLKSFQLIERLNGKFSAAATQRQQRLKRDEIDIKSGKIRMSPKELQAKRVRDTAESQRVERARSKFVRVMEGLRVLVKLAGESERGEKS